MTRPNEKRNDSTWTDVDGELSLDDRNLTITIDGFAVTIAPNQLTTEQRDVLRQFVNQAQVVTALNDVGPHGVVVAEEVRSAPIDTGAPGILYVAPGTKIGADNMALIGELFRRGVALLHAIPGEQSAKIAELEGRCGALSALLMRQKHRGGAQ